MTLKKAIAGLQGKSFIEDGGRIMIDSRNKKGFEYYMRLTNTSRSETIVELAESLRAAATNIPNILAKQ
jgi:hypothetical protein